MVKRILSIAAVLIFLSTSSFLYAGNPEVIHPITGESIGWNEAVPYWMDQGSLGILSNEQARILVEAMMGVWSDVETADIVFSYKGDLVEDVTDENISDFLAAATCGGGDRSDIPQDVVPVVFDTDGKIIENLVGAGSAGEVGGISTLRCFNGTLANPTSIFQGMIVINGQFIDGKGASDGSPTDLSVNTLSGVVLHELGHLIGLDHTSVNEGIYDAISAGSLGVEYSKYLPVMLPTVLRGSVASTTLHPDDISALSVIYPAESYLSGVGEISGEIIDNEGFDVRKVNVIARKDDDPLCEAVSAVTGRKCVPLVDITNSPNFNVTKCESEDLYGDYLIEGLLPGKYTVEVEELSAGWIRKGMYPNSVDNDLPGDAEFYNEGESGNDSIFEYSFVTVDGGNRSEDIDIILNSSEADPAQLDRIPYEEFEEGPATRCLLDKGDYAVLMNGGDSGSLSLSDSSSDLLKEIVTPGGCSLNKSGKANMTIIFVFCVILAALIIRKTKIKKTVAGIIFAWILLFSFGALASSVIPVSLEQMTEKAGRIFYGRCIDTEVIEDEHGVVSTLVTYEIIRNVRGEDSEEVTFKVFGDAAGGNREGRDSTLVGGISFETGREDILFLYGESKWGFTSPVGIWNGAFPVLQTKNGKKVSTGRYRKGLGSSGMLKGSSVPADSSVSPDDFLDDIEKMIREND